MLSSISVPKNMEKAGHGCCRFGGIPKQNWKKKGYKTLNECLKLCGGDPTCKGADFGKPKDNKFDCVHYINDKAPSSFNVGCKENKQVFQQCFKKRVGKSNLGSFPVKGGRNLKKGRKLPPAAQSIAMKAEQNALMKEQAKLNHSVLNFLLVLPMKANCHCILFF